MILVSVTYFPSALSFRPVLLRTKCMDRPKSLMLLDRLLLKVKIAGMYLEMFLLYVKPKLTFRNEIKYFSRCA